MPHHWKPLDPGNPDCGDAVRRLKEKYGEGLKYVGFDGEKCWALYRLPVRKRTMKRSGLIYVNAET